MLAFWTPEAAAAVENLDEAAELLWVDALSAWEDEALHDAFLKHCSQAGLLAPAGRRYRDRLDTNPGDGVAARMQDRILKMATAAFGFHAAPPVPVTRTRTFWLIAFVGLVIGAIAGLLFVRR